MAKVFYVDRIARGVYSSVGNNVSKCVAADWIAAVDDTLGDLAAGAKGDMIMYSCLIETPSNFALN